VLERLRTLVSAQGLEVDTAADGPAALRQLERSFAPILILDRNMPSMDGLAVCRTIRERHWPGYIYILMLTVQDADEDCLTGLEAGADDYVSKRCSAAHLLARLCTARRILTLEQSLKTALEEKQRLSLTDMLTGAPNRRYFYRHFEGELRRIQRTGGPLTLLSLDIDHFKTINDRYGHPGGDAILCEFVRRVESCLRGGTDWCARLGGEEFAVVLADTPPHHGRQRAEAIRQAVAAAPFQTAAGTVRITVSIGVSGCEAIAPGAPITLESLLQQSDQHLYASKANGRNCVHPPVGVHGR
jgi:two-component system cell cycle response regulator